jgi:hypothetical protein
MFYYRFYSPNQAYHRHYCYDPWTKLRSDELFSLDSGFRYCKCFTTGSYFAINTLETIPYHLCFYSLRKP